MHHKFPVILFANVWKWGTQTHIGEQQIVYLFSQKISLLVPQRQALITLLNLIYVQWKILYFFF